LHFEQFFKISQIWTTTDSNNWIKWVENLYSCYLAQFKTFSWNQKKVWIFWPRCTTMIVCPNDLKILKIANKVWKLWDLPVSQDIICKGYSKKLNEL
jgi:hypothetical protein